MLRDQASKKNLEIIYSKLASKGTHLSDLVVNNDPDKFYNFNAQQLSDHYEATISHIKNADAIVAEASIHSLAMGYIINKALDLNKPVVVLCTKHNLPFFLLGNNNLNLQILEYNSNDLAGTINEAFEFISTKQDQRFNLMIPQEMVDFLNEKSKNINVSKAKIIRDAIKVMMEKDLTK